ncbi:DUF5666 domain-containing protein [Thermus amyloliquefaciens]|uniref:DUF5666 domain-containing protein n=1 Tax=Thermus amyloliquefaciens TaxID=1449080 RepID=UPI0005713976|nr:DUF5666 domain-containing protein [Thermus amyloliquefaciens]
MGKRLILFWSMVLLAACQLGPQAGQEYQAVGVLGGTPERPTLMGKALDTSGASLTKEGEAFTGTLLPGMVVQVSGQDLGSTVRVASLDVRVELKGPITALDPMAGTLEVLGQGVQTDANTRIYEKAGGVYRTLLLSDLRVGDVVEVHGTATASGVLASYIERYPAATQGVELEGQATGLDPAAMTFLLNGYVVDYSGARVTGTPKEGAWVEVKGILSGTTIQASKVEFKTSGHNGYGASRRLELEGPIQALDETAKTFQLLGYLVDYRGATVVGTLSEGVYVEAKGQLDPANPSLLHAQLVKVKYPGSRPPKAEAKGQVTAIDPAAYTFELGSLRFYVDSRTVLKRDDPDGPIAFADIRVGDHAEVRYDPSTLDADGRFYAVKVEIKGTGGENGTSEWEGPASAVDRTAYTFQLLGYLVTTSPTTRFEAQDRYLSQGEFFSLLQEGDRVEVKGTLSGGVISAEKVELKRR